MPSPPHNIFHHLPQLQSIDDDLDLDLDLELKSDTHKLCPYCDDILPSILPEKIQNQLHNLQNKSITEEERHLFCVMHHAELHIVPLGLSKGYPEYIDFDQLSLRITKFKKEILDIINGNISSFYHNTALSLYKEMGYNKAKTPMVLINRCEIFQVSNCLFVF